MIPHIVLINKGIRQECLVYQLLRPLNVYDFLFYTDIFNFLALEP